MQGKMKKYGIKELLEPAVNINKGSGWQIGSGLITNLCSITFYKVPNVTNLGEPSSL